MPRFSVLIPAYKELGYTAENIEKLARQGDVEFLVAPQALSEEELDELKSLARRYPLRLFIYDEAVGKVAAVNEMIKHAQGDILIFVDSDTKIVNERLLDDVEEALKRGDFGSGVILTKGKGVLKGGIKVDYLNISAVLFLQSLVGFSFGLNGAFFFAKKKVVNELNGFAPMIVEDVDFGIRASEKGFRFVFIDKPCAVTDSPDTWKGWVKQRKRWYMGGVQAIIVHWKKIASRPHIAALQTLAYAPALPVYLSFLFLPNQYLEKIVVLLSSALVIPFGGLLPLFYVASLYLATKYLAVFLAGYPALLVWTMYWKKRWKVGISLKDTLAYYFVYAPLSFVLMMAATVQTLLKRKIRAEDWVVLKEHVSPVLYP